MTWIFLKILGWLAILLVPFFFNFPRFFKDFGVKMGRSWIWAPLTIYTVLTFLELSLVLILYYFFPVDYVFFTGEDSWGEWFTFTGFFLSFGVMTWAIFKRKEMRKPGFFLLAAGSFFVAMEEINWGQRILAFSTPPFFTEHNWQNVVNFHNVGTVLPDRRTIGIFLLLFTILLPLLVKRSIWLRRICDRFGIPLTSTYLWPPFLLAIFFWIHPTMLRPDDRPDLFYIHSPILKSDEVSEFFLGLAIVMLSFDLSLWKGRTSRTHYGQMALGSGCIISHVLLLSFYCVFVFRPLGDKSWRLNDFAGNLYPKVGMFRQAEAVFDYLEKNPKFRTSQTGLHQGQLFMQMGRQGRAQEILERALSEQSHLVQQRPEDPIPNRDAGVIYKLLGKPQQAEVAFREVGFQNDHKFAEAKSTFLPAGVEGS